MEESDPGKIGIQELIAGYAAGLGIDRTRLRFKWERKRLVLPEHGLELKGHILELRIFLGKRSEVLSFSEEVVESSTRDAYTFVSNYTDHVIAALRKLKRPEKGSVSE